MRIAVIASMKKGLEHFIYRELTMFAAEACAISLFPTKYRSGTYQPQTGWHVHYRHPIVVLALQPLFLLRHPRRYTRLLIEAVRFGAFVEFALAWSISRKVADTDVIYAT